MARPVKWSRDLHGLRERATRSRTETWNRVDLEVLFGVGRATAQTLMKAIGAIQTVGGAHFVERAALLAFLDNMAEAPSVDQALRERLAKAEPAPRPRPLRIALPRDLRTAMLPDLPANVTLTPGRIEILAPTAVGMLESLLTLALVMQNDLDRIQAVLEPPPAAARAPDEALKTWLSHLRAAHPTTTLESEGDQA